MTNAERPIVSVVFTSYNHVKYLEQALDSIVNQTYKKFELIIVDDCSTDGSQEILKRYSSEFSKIKLHLLEKNTGSYVTASNYGAKYALGDFILFAQCDDFSAPTQIEKLVKTFIENPGVGVVYSRSNLVDKSGHVYLNDYVSREKKFKKKCVNDAIILGHEMRNYLSFSCVIPNLSAALIQKKLYIESGGLSEKYLMAADWAFWLEMSEKTNFYYLSEPLNNFRQHETTIRSQVKIAKQILEIYMVFYSHLSKYTLTSSERWGIKSGAGAAWFYYLITSPKASILCFPSVLKETYKIEKRNVFFLIIGGFAFTKQHILKKIDTLFN
jgi:glycosyltransferase involved in cell wall biosynthesis